MTAHPIWTITRKFPVWYSYRTTISLATEFQANCGSIFQRRL